jgi:hypothetical protein
MHSLQHAGAGACSRFQGGVTGSSSTGPSRATDGFDAPLLHRRAAKANSGTRGPRLVYNSTHKDSHVPNNLELPEILRKSVKAESVVHQHRESVKQSRI